jgi:hypothetical protein
MTSVIRSAQNDTNIQASSTYAERGKAVLALAVLSSISCYSISSSISKIKFLLTPAVNGIMLLPWNRERSGGSNGLPLKNGTGSPRAITRKFS